MSHNRDANYYRQRTGVDVNVHLYPDSVMDVRVPDGANYATLHLGEHRGDLTIFVGRTELPRLYELLDRAARGLGMTLASEHAYEAYCNGWDDAMSWLQKQNDEPIPANVPGELREAG
jgi:hypothetical protein